MNLKPTDKDYLLGYIFGKIGRYLTEKCLLRIISSITFGNKYLFFTNKMISTEETP